MKNSANDGKTPWSKEKAAPGSEKPKAAYNITGTDQT